MQYVLTALIPAVLVGAFVVGLVRVWLRRRREAPLRRAIRAQRVTFWIDDIAVKEKQSDSWWG